MQNCTENNLFFLPGEMRACHITPSTLRATLSNKPINKLYSSKYFTIIYLLYCRITRLSHFFSHSSILALLSAVLFSIFYSLDSMFKCDVLLFVLLFRLTLRFHISSIVFCVVNHYCMFAPQYALSVQPSSDHHNHHHHEDDENQQHDPCA